MKNCLQAHPLCNIIFLGFYGGSKSIIHNIIQNQPINGVGTRWAGGATTPGRQIYLAHIRAQNSVMRQGAVVASYTITTNECLIPCWRSK